MFKNSLFYTFVVILFLQKVLTNDPCEKHMNCQKCIRDVNNCVWCGKNELNEVRCKQENSITDDWCSNNQENPKSYLDKNIPENRDFSSLKNNVVQIKPQKYKLYLRPGQKLNFTFSFKAAEDYPVDMYFLLDISSTMITVNKMAANQTRSIYSTMRTMTKDVNLGFGTFIDKNAFPFTDVINSTSTYSYQHHLSLSDHIEELEEALVNIPSGSNYDLPEGALDALAQAMACKNVVGWRNQSTKIIILSTDAPFHVAGDGKNGGIFQPYDGKCYTENARYTKELEMDYPTIGILKKLSITNEIIVIFFVDKVVQPFYYDLSNLVTGWKCETFDRRLLNGGGEIFVSTLKTIYEEITKEVKFKVNVRSGSKKSIHIKFDPDCNINSTACKVKSNQKTDIIGTITLTEYDETDNYILDIGVEGMSDKLTLDVDVLRDCDCENKGKRTEYCSNEIQECGICDCGEKRYGDRCACERNSLNSFNVLDSGCIAIGSNEKCSGAGLCICGTCKCSPGFNGKYCQCNDNSCPHGIGGHCNGPEKGICDCGSCRCKGLWTGDTCECLNSNEDCIGSDQKVCSGLGSCVCNKCKCPEIATWDGRNTEDKRFCKLGLSPERVGHQCDLVAHCVLCELGYTEECLDCDAVERNITTSLESYLNSTEWTDCPEIRVKVGCYTHYVFKYKENVYGMIVQILEKMDCTGGYYIYGGVALLTLLLVGLGTLIAWKVCTEAHYKSEYEKFLREHKDDLTEFSSNPLYEPPSTTVTNPTFRKWSFTK